MTFESSRLCIHIESFAREQLFEKPSVSHSADVRACVVRTALVYPARPIHATDEVIYGTSNAMPNGTRGELDEYRPCPGRWDCRSWASQGRQ
jgi:hypothetical protein